MQFGIMPNIDDTIEIGGPLDLVSHAPDEVNSSVKVKGLSRVIVDVDSVVGGDFAFIWPPPGISSPFRIGFGSALFGQEIREVLDISILKKRVNTSIRDFCYDL